MLNLLSCTMVYESIIPRHKVSLCKLAVLCTHHREVRHVDFVPAFDLRYLGARALCAQSPGVYVSIIWNLKHPNPVRVKTSPTLTGLAETSSCVTRPRVRPPVGDVCPILRS